MDPPGPSPPRSEAARRRSRRAARHAPSASPSAPSPAPRLACAWPSRPAAARPPPPPSSCRTVPARRPRWRASPVFVTHDRAFLQRLATRIVELDRGRLTSWPGDYATYLRRKDEALASEAAQQDKFDKKLAEEEAWLRQGIKARRT